MCIYICLDFRVLSREDHLEECVKGASERMRERVREREYEIGMRALVCDDDNVSNKTNIVFNCERM